MLTEAALRATRPKDKPYRLSDGEGMYLEVTPKAHAKGGRYWRLAYRFEGRQKTLALGVYPATSLKLAREKRDTARALLAAGKDPGAERKTAKASGADTFETLAREFMEKQRNRVTASTWQRDMDQLERIYFPTLRARTIGSIEAPELLRCLRKVEAAGHVETAHRARGLAGRVFRYAISTGAAKRDPAADLRGALEPAISRSYPAITDPVKVGALLRAIEGFDGLPTTVAALKLAPLVFVRPGELRGALWAEFDLEGEEPLWRIPAERMKARREHLVPLSRQAVDILCELHGLTGHGQYVFPAIGKAGRPMSENTINAALLRMGYSRDQMTAHGFRSTASTLLNELNWNADAIEIQLAHKSKDVVRGVYNRAEKLPQRREMMQAWADHLDGLKASGNVVPIRRPA